MGRVGREVTQRRWVMLSWVGTAAIPGKQIDTNGRDKTVSPNTDTIRYE